MSNLITNMKRREKRFTKKGIKQVMNQTNKTKTINFKDRILPRTLLVDVKSGTLFIGDDKNPIGSCQQLHSGTTLEENAAFAKAVEAIGDKNVDKVILDNGDGFKVWSFKEFLKPLYEFIKKAQPMIDAGVDTKPQSDTKSDQSDDC